MRVVLFLLLLTAAAYPDWSYNVAYANGALDVTATFTGEPWLDDDYWPYVSQLTRSGNTVRYRFDLRKCAREQRHYKVASLHGDAILTTPSTFLIRPYHADRGVYTLNITGGLAATTRAPTAALDHAPAAVFGTYKTRQFPVLKGTVQLVYQQTPLPDKELLNWVNLSVNALADYFGQLPMNDVLLVILTHDGRGVRGLAQGNSVLMLPSKTMSKEELRHDWTLMHELTHLGFPCVPYAFHWVEEGLATYLEPILRIRAGDFPTQKMWADMRENLPPSFPDESVLESHDYNRYYWGGALFWFLADLRIRLETPYTLQTALQSIVKNGGNLNADWTLEQALRTGDEAIKQPILEETLQTKTVDLAWYWRQLDGPWAHIRDAITAKTGSTRP